MVGDIAFGGGAERMTISLANNLVSNADVILLSINDFNIEDLLFDLNDEITIKSLGIRGWNKPGAIRKNYFKLVLRLRKFLINSDIDILINVQVLNILWSFPALLGTKIPCICWEHMNLKSQNSIFHKISIILAKKIANRIVVLTERDKKYWNSENVLSISNFSSYNLPNVNILQKENRIIAIGRFCYQKSFDRLLEIWEIVENSEKFNCYTLEIYGEGEQGELLRSLIKLKKLKYVSLHPFTKRIDLVYEKACLLLMSSRFEGYPMVLIEAAQFGIPSIAFDILTGPSEIISPNYTGYLVEDGDYKEFANRILNLISDKEKLIQLQKNTLNFRLNFESQKIVDTWLDMFDSI